MWPRPQIIRWLGHHDVRLLIVLAVALGSIWSFVELTDEVVEEEPHRIDRAILLAMRSAGDPQDPIGPAWFEELARDVTALGGTAVLVTLTLATFGFLALRRQWTIAITIAIAIVGAECMSSILKAIVDRPRPDLVPPLMRVYTASFPSGHAMLSMAAYLTLATQLARVQKDTIVRGYLIAAALVIVVAIGLSRIYLGVHWPSDVLAGWSLGLGWVLLVWLGAQLHARHSPSPQPS